MLSGDLKTNRPAHKDLYSIHPSTFYLGVIQFGPSNKFAKAFR